MKKHTMNQIIKRTGLSGADAKIARVVGRLGIDLNAPEEGTMREQIKELRKSSERNGMAHDVVSKLLCTTFSISPEALRALEADDEDEESDEDEDAGSGDDDDDADADDVIDEDDSDVGDDDDSDDSGDDDDEDDDDDESDEDTRRAVAKPSKTTKKKRAPSKSKPVVKKKASLSLPDWISSQMASGTAYQEIRRVALTRGASPHVFVTAWRAARAGRIASRAERAHARKVGISA